MYMLVSSVVRCMKGLLSNCIKRIDYFRSSFVLQVSSLILLLFKYIRGSFPAFQIDGITLRSVCEYVCSWAYIE